ncbi:alpha/beta fold hydrolase [Streptosporangiaceae bacterium NEAU-GS5]|nr:alpha/beta fold hydrolase [Streptosporangiaceae bacterium NEAU-GS5]
MWRSEQGARAVQEGYRRLLARWPVPAEQLTVGTRQGETFVVACGPAGAPALVLLHGSGSNSAMWLGDVAAWAGRFRVYAVDVIGEPGLSAPSRPPLDSEAYAVWLDDVLDGLGVARASVVGLSLGGWLALDYAIRRPARVARLALISPAGIGRAKIGFALLALALLPFGERGRRIALRRALGRSDAGSGPFGDFLMLIHRGFRPRRERLPVFSGAALAGLAMPVLAVVGGRDGMLDSYGTRRRLSAVPSARVVLLPEAGHPPLGQSAAILDFLRAG